MTHFFKITAFVACLFAGMSASVAQSTLACTQSQNICSNPSFTFNASVSNGLTGNLNISNPTTNPQVGNGANPAGPSNSGCLLTNGPGPQWLLLTISSTGTLGFVFGGAGSAYPQVGLYDWAMWSYNPNTCNNIFNNTQAPVACNWNCSSSGGTGMGPPPASVPGTTPSACNFQPGISVTAGQQYLILLSNFSSVTTTVSIANNGSAGLTCSPFIIPNGYACPNQTAVVTATWSGYSNTTFTLNPGGIVQNSPSFTVSAPATQVYTVFAQGTDPANAVSTATTTFTLNVAPTTSITVTPSQTVCMNSSVTLVAALPTATAYSWAGPNGFAATGSSVSLAPIQPTASGVYTVSTNYIMAGSNPTVTCPRTATTQINVIVTNTVATLAEIDQCPGTIIGLSASAGGANSYLWVGPSFTSTTQNPIINNSTPAMSGNYTVTAYFLIGSYTCTTQGITTVSIAPTTSINASAPQTVCVNGAANLTASLPTATAYSWAGPGNFTGTGASIFLTNIQPTVAGVYTVSANYNFATNSQILVCPRSSTTQLTVVQVPSVTVVPSFTLCEGSTLFLTANATGTPSYLWSGPNYTSAAQNPTLSSIAPAAAGDYSVLAYFTIGALTCTNQAITNVSVVATPSVVVFSSGNVCQNDVATLSANAAGAIGFRWTGPGGFKDTVQLITLASIQPSQAGIYYATAIFGIGTQTCSMTSSTLISVVPVNTVTVNSPLNICQPGSANLQASAASAVSYSWSGPPSPTGAPTFTAATGNATYFYPPVSASGIYTVRASFISGTLTCYNTNTLSLTVNPVLNFTLVPYRQLCFNDSVFIPGPAGATSYTWTSSSGFTSNSQNLMIPAAQPTMAGVYTLSVSLGPCQSTGQTQLKILSPLQFSLTPNSKTICRGDEFTVQAGAYGGSDNYAYTWEPSIYLSAPTGSILNVNALGTTIYNVFAYDIACPSYSISSTFTVNVNQPPQPDLRLTTTKGCEPLCLMYYPRTENDAALTTFDFGGLKQWQLLGDSMYFCLPEPGTYTLNIQSKGKNGCLGTYQYPEPLVVYPKPHTDITWDPPVPTTTENHVVFSPVYKYEPVTSHNWMFTGTGSAGYDTTGVKNPERTFENIGKYPLMLVSTTDMGCTDTVIKILTIRDEFNVYIPNTFTPNNDGVNDFFQIKGIGLKTEGFSMEIFDRWGQSVYSTTDLMKGWDGTVKGQPGVIGMYVYKVKVIGANGEGRLEYTGHVTLLR